MMANNWQDCSNVAKLVIFLAALVPFIKPLGSSQCDMTYVTFHANGYKFFAVLGLIIFSEIILVTLFRIEFFYLSLSLGQLI